ncbi:MAG: PHP domain-containing protein [Candidatus Magasanikbacteria bacterium]
MKLIFHAHTKSSIDCELELEQIANKCNQLGIDAVLLTDHDRLSPSKKINGVQFYPGEEIMTKQGEIIGLFLKEEIQPGLTASDTIAKIKQQNGLVTIPHPFDRFRSSALDKKIIEKHLDKIDIIETYNARNLVDKDNKKAKEFFEENKQDYNLVEIVGSDAHILSGFENTCIEIEEFSDPQNFLENLKKANFHQKKINLLQKIPPHIYTKGKKILN